MTAKSSGPGRAAWAAGVACAASALALGIAPAARAHDGHDHGAAPASVNADGPQRLPDGSVFLPKPAQRQMTVRTMPVQAQALPRAVTLNGTVVVDPDAGGKVQPTMAGRIEPGPGGLPGVGETVRRGQVLAWVQPSAGSIERSNQLALLAELRAQRVPAEARLARLRELTDTVPRREIEAVEAEARSLAARIAALEAGLGAREALRAPVGGTIAAAHVVSGQVVEPRELVFEIVDPSRLRIEALSYDPALADDVAAASLALPGGPVELAYAGAARVLRGQALPLVFAARGPRLAALAVGQPVVVVVQTRSRVQGVAVPASALMKNPSNQDVVWVKTAPERFEPRVVTIAPLDGARVVVTSGLEGGERVVTQGAALVNQVR